MHLWTFYLDGIYRKVEFWDSKISGKKKIAVDSKVLALDDSGCSHYKCTFSIAPHILKLIQIDEDNFDFMSPSEINKIKKNLNNNKNEGKNEDTFYKNKNILKNIDFFGDNNPSQKNVRGSRKRKYK